MKKRVGDTLVEVTLAIGIFSLVAIAVVAVMTGGTSSAQTALETTLAREEIDVQAEAIRFIHSAYLASADSGIDSSYTTLWDKITARAIKNKTDDPGYLNYTPKTCQEVQNSNTLKKYGFVINPRALSTDTEHAYVAYNSSLFKTAATAPRLIYSAAEANNTDELVGSPISNNLYRVEGIYVFAVKDLDSSKIVKNTTTTALGSGFYDFYIRTCWYGAGADSPSTISTVIRLYNPPDTTDRYTTPTVRINFHPNGGDGTMDSIVIKAGQSVTIPASSFTNTSSGKTLKWLGWNTTQDATGYGYQRDGTLRATSQGFTYQPGTTYKAPTSLSSYQVIDLYSIWDRIAINYNTNHSSGDTVTSVPVSYCLSYSSCQISTTIPTRADSHSGYTFKGWATTKNAPTATIMPGGTINPTGTSITLYAVWERYEIIYNPNGGSYPPANTYCMSKVGCFITTEKAEDGKYLPRRSGYEFLGWATSSTATKPTYKPGDLFTPTSPTTTLYAVWKAKNEKITIKLTWGYSPSDLDSHVEGQKSNGTSFHAYYSNKVGSDIDGTTIAQLDTDITSGYGPETFTINTFGGRNYYYYVHNYSGSGSFNGATVEVSGPELGTLTYYSNNATGYGRYWNVFAYKDGLIVPRMTFTSSPEVSY